MFADVSSTMQTRLEAVIDAINATIAGLEREVKQRGARTVTVHVRVQEETLQVHFPVGSAAKSIVLNRGSMKNLSPDTLFSTTVKDIPEVEELINKIQLRGSSSSCSSSQAQGGANQSEGAAWAVAGSVRELAKSKKRRIVVDSDDEEAYQEELQRQRAAKQQQQRAEELARLKEATDFHSEVSIDAVKRAYGASAELLATAVPNAQGAGGSSSSGGSGGSGSGVGSSSGAIGVDNDDAQREEEFDFANDPIADSAESPHRQLLGRLPLNESCTGIATPEVKTIRVRVYSPAVSDPASIKTKHKHSIPELGMQLVFERAAGGDVQCVTATVQLLNPASWCCYAPPMKDAYKRVPSVAVADILDEVRDQLWLATALSRSVEALEALEAMKLIMLWWPIAIQIGDVLYSRGEPSGL